MLTLLLMKMAITAIISVFIILLIRIVDCISLQVHLSHGSEV